MRRGSARTRSESGPQPGLELLVLRVEKRLGEVHRVLQAAPHARGNGADLEGPGLDAAGVEQVLDEVLEAQGAAPKGRHHRHELRRGHQERVVDEQVERGRERRDGGAQLVRHLEQEVLLEAQELRLRGDVPDRVQDAALADRGAHDLEHTHAVLAREPGATYVVTVRRLHRRGAGDEEQLLETSARELLLAEHAERGGVRAEDDAVGAGQDDAVGEGDERVLDRESLEGAVVGATTQRAPALGGPSRSLRRDPQAHSRALTGARVERELRADEARGFAHLQQAEAPALRVGLENGRDIESLAVVLDHRDDGAGVVVHVDRDVRRAAGLDRVVRGFADDGERAGLDLRARVAAATRRGASRHASR